eukprot:6173398-Pleurochrysis_carterae.AAC.2
MKCMLDIRAVSWSERLILVQVIRSVDSVSPVRRAPAPASDACAGAAYGSSLWRTQYTIRMLHTVRADPSESRLDEACS